MFSWASRIPYAQHFMKAITKNPMVAILLAFFSLGVFPGCGRRKREHPPNQHTEHAQINDMQIQCLKENAVNGDKDAAIRVRDYYFGRRDYERSYIWAELSIGIPGEKASKKLAQIEDEIKKAISEEAHSIPNRPSSSSSDGDHEDKNRLLVEKRDALEGDGHFWAKIVEAIDGKKHGELVMGIRDAVIGKFHQTTGCGGGRCIGIK